MSPETIQTRLLRHYSIGATIPAIATALLFFARKTNRLHPFEIELGTTLGPWLLFLAITLAVAMPIFLRTLFAHRLRDAQYTSLKDFYRLQKRLLFVSIAATYLLPVVPLVVLPAFYQSAVILAALYGLYFHFPSVRRITFDYKIFRVRDDATA